MNAHKIISGFGGVVAALLVMGAILVGYSPRASAAQAISPVAQDMCRTNPNSVYATNDICPPAGAGQGQNVFHVLKNESSSSVFDVDMYVYFNSASAGRYITIQDRNTSPPDRCMTTGNQRYPAAAGQIPGNYFVAVRISTVPPTPVSSVTYYIPRDRVCGATHNRPGDANTPGSANSNFFAQYPVPPGFASATPDPETNLYKLRIEIDLNRNVPEQLTSDPNNRQQAMFRVYTDNSCDNTCTFSSVRTGDHPTRNTSTLGSTNDQRYRNQYMYFGLPCSETTPQERSLVIYDVDNGSANSSWDSSSPDSDHIARFQVQFKNSAGGWTNLSRSQYRGTPPMTPFAGITGGTFTAAPVFAVPNASQTRVYFQMQPHTQYRVKLGPIWSGNLVGFGLPDENIFGKFGCDTRVTGRVDPSRTGPVMSGEDVTFQPYLTRSGNSPLPSRVGYELVMWYDKTGDHTYDASTGDDKITAPASCQQTGDRSLTANGDAAPGLASCPVTVDTSRAGGDAEAVCAQLVITRRDTLTQITQPSIRCVSIGKRPHLYAANGDVFAGGVLSNVGNCTITTSPIISGSQVSVGGSQYSSWGTYGVTSLGTSRAFGSNNMRAGQATSTALVFANRRVTGPFGLSHGYFYNLNSNASGLPDQTRCLNEPFSTFTPLVVPTAFVSTVDLSSIVGAGGGTVARSYNVGNGTLTVAASQPIPRGTKVIIYARGAGANVKIASNIQYENTTYSSIDQIPQVVVLADQDIIVGEAVSRVDGILGARRDLVTCELPSGLSQPRLGVCDSHLQINGAIVAGGKVRPYRTWGGELSTSRGTDYGTPAEDFNLTPGTLLNSLPVPGSQNVNIRTTSEVEAPPRF